MGSSTNQDFRMDIEAIRKKARANMDDGAVTDGLHADRKVVIGLLQSALATELVCTLRYKQNAIIAEDIGSEIVGKEFWEHADQELQHADRLAKRIALLGGTPDYNPDTLTSRSHADYVGFDDSMENVLGEMLKENLVAERIAVETYQEIVRFIGDKDPTTRRLFEDLLAEEEEHADDLMALLNAQRGTTAASVGVPAL